MKPLRPFKQVQFTEVAFSVSCFDVRFNTEIPKLRHRVGLGGVKMKGEHVGVFFLGCCLGSCLHLPNPSVILQVPAEWTQVGPVQGPGLAWQQRKG